MSATHRYPYLDRTVELLEAADPEIGRAFGRHWHWGYWDRPERAAGTLEDQTRAMERMSEHFLELARVGDGQRVLDAGCGFGGTIAVANARHTGLALTGLNVDARQLAFARRNLVAAAGNSIDFVEGDACRPPFPDASFDRVLAVECIFHFPSRRRFFEEARRLLVPRGLLTVSDFIPAWWLSYTPLQLLFRAGQARRTKAWGKTRSMEPTNYFYRRLAARTGFEPAFAKDVTANVQPTHATLERLAGRLGPEVAAEVRDIDVSMKLKLCTYQILVFRRL